MAASDDRNSLDVVLEDMAWIRRLAHRLVRDEAERDDVVQQAWLEALTGASQADDRRPWLAGVLKNVARMKYRGDSRRRVRESAVQQELTEPPPSELV
ncbi:MAG TPA: sigma factor, partial [Polyangia bacterium]